MNGKNLIDRFAKAPSEGCINELIVWAESGNPSDSEIGYLANTLANSGSRLASGNYRADIPSTGGPSSLSTILCPLILAQFSFIIPKLGVPGRPAGGIDVLAQIPGYKFTYTKIEIENLLSKTNYVHFLANQDFTPLDRLLFEHRKKIGRIDVSALVIASLLSKKLACGLSLIGLDIRVSSFGNFGKNNKEAQTNALRFINVSKSLGIKATCFLTTTEYALQPYIGRGESLIAISKILNANFSEEKSLKGHFDNCLLMSQALLKMTDEFSFNKIIESFSLNLEMQGTTLQSFNNKVEELISQDRLDITARDTGFFHYDLRKIRDLITSYQNKFITSTNPFPDPCGIHFLREIGEHVNASDNLAEVRFDSRLLGISELRTSFSEILNTTDRVLKIDKSIKIISDG